MNESTGLRRVSLCATLALTSHAEFAAGVAAGLPLWHPWGNGGHDGLPIGLPLLLPVAIDCYVVDALERRHGVDRFAALAILALSVIGGSAYVAANRAEGLKAAGVGVVLVLVLARLYATSKPSRADVAAEASANAERLAEEDRLALVEQRREREASRLRIEEAEHLARIDAARVQSDAEAAGLRIRAEADAEALKSQAAADLARTASEAEVARVHAESAAEVARIQAESAVPSPQRPRTASAKRPANRPRTSGKGGSVDAPDKDDAARWVASAIRDHEGPEPFVFKWEDWQKKHGGGRSFWFAAKQAAEQGPHLAKAANQ